MVLSDKKTNGQYKEIYEKPYNGKSNPIGNFFAGGVNIFQRLLNDVGGSFEGVLRLIEGLIDKFFLLLEKGLKNLGITTGDVLESFKCVIKQPLHFLDCFKSSE